MKHFAKALALLLVFCMVGALLVACTGETGTQTEGKTDAPATEKETDGTTQEPATEPATEEGSHVTYNKQENTTTIEGFDTSKIGTVAAPGQTGVLTIFDHNFDDGDASCGGDAAGRAENSAGVVDGVIYIPYSKENADHLSDGWTTWSPLTAASLKENYQVQLSVDMTLKSGGGAWMSAFWGCYVSDYAGKIPDGPGDGLWFSLNNNKKEVTVYGGSISSWPAGIVSVPVADGMLDGEFRLSIVCTQDKTTYVYSTKGDKTVCLCVVSFTDGNMIVKDAADAEVFKGACDVSSLAGDHFTYFGHGGGGAAMDNMQILACTPTKTTTETIITATPDEGYKLGYDITNRKDVVSLCYSTWHTAILGDGTDPITEFLNITDILAGKMEWGGVPAFHYWAKPAQGYYRSTDETAIRNNLSMIGEAGVDFIILDGTNYMQGGYAPGTANWSVAIYKPWSMLLDTVMTMRAEGKKVPYVVFWMNDASMFETLWEYFYSVEKWEDCFVYWDEKPFIMNAHGDPDTTGHYTLRAMWGLTNTQDSSWSFMNIDNNKSICYASDGSVEQMVAGVAAQETYMSNTKTAHGRNHGIFWYDQWSNVFENHPKVVTLCWWNEWAAQRLSTDTNVAFTDAYNAEFSRDIEPMEGGHGDQYYKWMMEYIKAYKSHSECPRLVEEGY